MNFVALDKEQHKELKFSKTVDFTFAAEAHLSAVNIREFAQLASCMPIVFVKDEKNPFHHPVAMLGLEPQKSLYVHDKKWQAPQIPANVQRFPFDLRPGGEQLTVFVDEDSELLNKEDGVALFADGEPSAALQGRLRLLDFIAQGERATREFMKEVEELGLLTDVEIRIIDNDNKGRALTGMKVISEEALMKLTDEKAAEFFKKGWIGAIYASMMSMAQLNKLVELSNKTDAPIRSIQVIDPVRAAAAEKAAEQTEQ